MARVYGRSGPLRLASARIRRWKGFDVVECSSICGAFLTFLSIFVELALFPRFPISLGIAPSGRAVAAALFLLPVQGGVVAWTLASRREAGSGWLLGCCWALGSLPLLGFYAFPLWSKLSRRQTRIRHARLSPRLEGPGLSGLKVPWWRQPPSVPVHVTWIFSNLMLPTLGALWVVRRLGGHSGATLIAVCAMRLVGSVCAAHSFVSVRPRAGGWRSYLLRGLLLLLPVPILGTIALFFIFPLLGGQRAERLVGEIYEGRWRASRLSLWQDVQKSLGQHWRTAPWWRRSFRPPGLEQAVNAGDAEKGVLSLYRVKAFLLVPEILGMLWLLAILMRHWPALGPPLFAALQRAWWISALLFGLGFAGEVLSLGLRLMRSTRWLEKLERNPCHRVLVSSNYFFLIVLMAAKLAIEKRPQDLANWLNVTASLGVVWVVLSHLLALVLPKGLTIRDEGKGIWVVLLTMLALFVLLGLLGRAVWVLGLIQALVILSPISALASGLTLGKWLLYPYTWSDLRTKDLARRTRLALTFLAVTICLPLGGLAAPLWVLVKFRPCTPR